VALERHDRDSLALELTPDLPTILADEDRAIQILTNLTGNALQDTPEGGGSGIGLTIARVG